MTEESNQRDCEFKARYEILGAHIHIDMFIRFKGQETWQNAGHIVIGTDQQLSLFHAWIGVNFEEKSKCSNKS